MSFTTEDITKIAKLARIGVSDDQKESLVNELGNILHWVEQLSEVDVSNMPPVAGVSGESLPLRADKVTTGNQVEDILRNAPAREFDCFVVPKVIDQG